MTHRTPSIIGLILSLCIPLTGFAAAPDPYPQKPVSMVVPFPPAGPTDSLARALSSAMQAHLSQPIVVENRAGSAGNIGTAHVARSKADGYTLLFASSGPLLINTSLFKKPGFDPLTDFTPIAYIGEIPNVMVVSTTSPAGTIQEFISLAKRENISYGSSGTGSTNHLAAEKFNKDNNVHMLHVPYKGTAQAVTDLIGGHISMMYLDVLTAAPFIKAGKLKALAVASAERSRVLPNVPTFREQGIATMEKGVAFGLLGPAHLPDEVRKTLAQAAALARHSQAMQESMSSLGVEAGSIESPQDFDNYIKREVKTWREVVHLSQATID